MKQPLTSLYMFCCLVVCAALAGCQPWVITIGGSSGRQSIVETQVLEPESWTDARVAVVDVSGVILNGKDAGFFGSGEHRVSLLHEMLEQAKQDDRVKGIILRIDSPGGTVTASDMMYREVMRFKQKTGKPVVVMMMGVAASGGYYVACAGDEIMAYPTTVTGSIGVIMQTMNVSQALANWGIETDAIKSGKNKDAGSPLSKNAPQQRKTLQRIVDGFYARFVKLVKTARKGKIAAADFEKVIDGRVFSGDDALRYGLVDGLGDIYDAFEKTKKRAGIKDARLVIYHRGNRSVGSVYNQAFKPNVGAGVMHGGTQINVGNLGFGNQAGSDFYYLWRGGQSH